MLNDFNQKGFLHFHEPEVLNFVNIDQHKLLNTEERSRDNGEKDVSKDLNDKLTTLAYYLKTKYIDPIWPNATYNKFLVWDGVDRDNQGWHTDQFEGYDVFILYYFDNTFKETGGGLHFKWNQSETTSFEPKAGDIFLVNNTRGFWHKADATTIKRRVASFDFNTNNS